MKDRKCNVFLFLLVLASMIITSCSSIDFEGLGEIGTVLEETGLADENPLISIAATTLKTTETISKVAEGISPETEYVVGRAVAATILSNYRLYDNPYVTDYVNKICKTITMNSPRPYLYKGYHVAILDSDEINAISSPGGHILISKGLIESTTSEDALAAVIAHEISHIQLGHSSESIRNDQWNQIGKAALDIGGDIMDIAYESKDKDFFYDVYNTINNSKDSVVNVLTQGYSKEQEFDADSNAVLLMVSAGYNPYALLDMLEAIKNDNNKSGRGWSKTHPSPELRIRSAKRALKSFSDSSSKMSYRRDRFEEFKKHLY